MFLKRFQLGLIHAAIAMTLVPIDGMLNRVMIKELSLSATLFAILASLAYLFSPIQVAIGSYSDRHPILGFRRTPYIFAGLLLCVISLITLPSVAFLMDKNLGLGIVAGIFAFGAWGMGYNLSAVSYLSLASELSGEKGRSKTVAIMWIMMIASAIMTSIWLGKATFEQWIHTNSGGDVHVETDVRCDPVKPHSADILHLSAAVAGWYPRTEYFVRAICGRSIRSWCRSNNVTGQFHLGNICLYCYGDCSSAGGPSRQTDCGTDW
jgi:MFS family permease